MECTQQEKVKAINSSPIPTEVKGLKAFLGLLKNLGDFFPKPEYGVTTSSSVLEKKSSNQGTGLLSVESVLITART